MNAYMCLCTIVEAVPIVVVCCYTTAEAVIHTESNNDDTVLVIIGSRLLRAYVLQWASFRIPKH